MNHSLRPRPWLAAGLSLLLLTGTAAAQKLATGDTRGVVIPHYPVLCTIVRAQFSTAQRATPPAADDTTRLQQALTSCAGTGKAVLLAPAGSADAFFSNTLTVSGEGLIVAGGVTLFGSNNYPKYLLDVSGANSSIWGPGTIDGRGDLIPGKPRLIEARDTENLNVADLTLTHAAKMHLYIEGGSNVTVWRLSVRTPANTKNTDGVDLDSLTNATVSDSFIEDGDDGVVVKTNSGPASSITVRNNRFYGTHGMSIGSQTMYGVSNVLWEDNQMFGTDEWGNVASDNNGIRIKSDPTCGGPVSQVTWRRTKLTGIKHLMIFNTSYGACSGNPGIPVYQDIVVDGLLAVSSQSGAYSEFQGYDADHPLDIWLAHVHLDANDQTKSQYAIVGIDDSTITPSGPGVTTFPFHLWYGQGR